MKKILNLFIIVLFVVAAFLISLRVMGLKPYVIESDSMEPTYSVNDIVYIKQTEFKDINKNDVITFVNTNDSIVTHRVEDINKEEKCLYTKGDANDFADVMPIYEEDIIGVVKFSIPKIGIFSIQLGEER